MQSFIDYCWSFYGPNQLYGEMFDHSLTKKELSAAVRLYLAINRYNPKTLDSIDRESIREILFFCRNKQQLTKLAMG